MKAIDRLLGDRLRVRRMEVDVDAVTVASVLGISEQALLSWEAGESRPLPEQLLELGELLDYSMSSLYQGLNFTESS